MARYWGLGPHTIPVLCLWLLTWSTALADPSPNNITAPVAGQTFYYLDTVEVSYLSNFSAAWLSVYCRNDNKVQQKYHQAVTPLNGTAYVELNFINAKRCWFNLAPQRDSNNGGFNGGNFQFIGVPRNMSSTGASATTASSTTTASNDGQSTGSAGSSGLSTGAQAGIGVGAGLGGIGLGALAAFLCFRRQTKRKSQSSEDYLREEDDSHRKDLTGSPSIALSPTSTDGPEWGYETPHDTYRSHDGYQAMMTPRSPNPSPHILADLAYSMPSDFGQRHSTPDAPQLARSHSALLPRPSQASSQPGVGPAPYVPQQQQSHNGHTMYNSPSELGDNEPEARLMMTLPEVAESKFERYELDGTIAYELPAAEPRPFSRQEADHRPP
ncbi:hypothetical protein F5Y15DRAFT_104110 [Xylariaceae sp. FL0016]|nr:hypothetical protein F5Y15DRAFT_104110 [Xylariaceae sp. FL0016]